MKYRRTAGGVPRAGSREVLVDGSGVHFNCPCGLQRRYASSAIHTITFDDEGLLTLDPSCGYRANSEHPANWCHFWLRAGVAEMVADAKCPGGS